MIWVLMLNFNGNFATDTVEEIQLNPLEYVLFPPSFSTSCVKAGEFFKYRDFECFKPHILPILSAEGIKEGLIAGMTCKQNLLCFGWQVHAKTAFYSHNSEFFLPLSGSVTSCGK